MGHRKVLRMRAKDISETINRYFQLLHRMEETSGIYKVRKIVMSPTNSQT